MSTPSIVSAIRKIRAIMTRSDKLQWLAIVGFAIVTSFFEIITASVVVAFAQVINEPEKGTEYLARIGMEAPAQPMMTVLYFALLIGVVYVVKNIVAASEVFFQNFSIQKMCYHFKNRILARYADIDYGLFLTRNSSYGVNVVSSDAERVYAAGMLSLAGILSESVVFLCLTSMVVFMNPSLAFTMFAIGLVLAAIVAKVLLPLFYRWGQRQQEATMQSIQHLYQFFHAFKEIILLNKSQYFIDSYKDHSYKRSIMQAKQIATNAMPRLVLEVLFIVFLIAAIAFLCLGQADPTQMVGILGGYLYVGFRLMPGMNRIIGHMNNFKAIISSVDRIDEECNLVTEKGNYVDVPEFTFNKSITIDNAYLRYLGTERDALEGVSLTIGKGECIGIVGETGSGKSTLVDLILGLLKPNTGSILIDEKYPVYSHQWHAHIGYVPQAIYLTDDTIEANIAFGEEKIDYDRLEKAVSDAQLGKFVAQLPQGLKTFVGERGIRVSGGERQRIAIARALYRQPDVLVFDEATSALDNDTEAQLIETVNAISRNRTVIMVAHRLTTLRGCDRIIAMNGGKIQRITDYETLVGGKKAYA